MRLVLAINLNVDAEVYAVERIDVDVDFKFMGDGGAFSAAELQLSPDPEAEAVAGLEGAEGKLGEVKKENADLREALKQARERAANAEVRSPSLLLPCVC